MNLRKFTLVCLVALLAASALFGLRKSSAQSIRANPTFPPTSLKIGEKLTYSVSFGRFQNAGYAELYTVSRGRLGNQDAVELFAKFKTNDIVSATFYNLNESRTTFADASSGLPLYVRKTSNDGVAPTETIKNFLLDPTQNFDLLTLIYRLRIAGGAGSFQLQENERIFPVLAQSGLSERIKTDAGEFDTFGSTIQSSFFREKGIESITVNYSVDEQRLPVSVKIESEKGQFRAMLVSIEKIIDPTEIDSIPIATPTPTPIATPTPLYTPTPILDNQPLLPNLPFVLGETLEYRITNGGKPVGTVVLRARERKTIQKKDILFLSATVTNADPGFGIFNVGDSIEAQVNALSLTPYSIDVKFSGSLRSINQSVVFDQDRGAATISNLSPVQIPLNTHSLLSLAYAVRSFNLKPSKDRLNPVNDTRVSVFYDSQYYIFTLRPLEAEIINIGGQKISAQMITIITGNPVLDAQTLRIWMTNDDRRTILRFVVGNYQADLVSQNIVLPK